MNQLRLPVIALALALGCASPAVAQDDDAAPAADVVTLKFTAKYDKKPDPTNYLLYFTWLNIHGYKVEAWSPTSCKGAKWMASKIKKAGGKLHKPSEANKDAATALNIELEADIRYTPLTAEFDGKKRVVGWGWKGKIEGAVKDASGKVLHKIALKHYWATNTKMSRKQAKSQYFSHLSSFLLADLYRLPAFVNRVPEDLREKLATDAEKFAALRKQYYDSNWSFKDKDEKGEDGEKDGKSGD